MTEDQFWSTFTEALERSPSDSPWPIREHLIDVLSPLTKPDLAEWERIFGSKMDECYDGFLWEAVILLTIGFHWCGDDSFRDLRETLIGCGKEVYEKITKNPDALIDHRYLLDSPEFYFFNCARDAWHLQFPNTESPDELIDELNDSQIVFEDRLNRPFPKFKELEEVLPRVSTFVRDNDPTYWKRLHDTANQATGA